MRVVQLHGLENLAIEEFVDRVKTGSLVVALAKPLPQVVLADPDDDIVVATAVAGDADAICTRNNHLSYPDVLAYCSERSVRVVDDLQLLREIRAIDAPPT